MIVRKETAVTLDGLGTVHFEPLQRAGEYWRTNYNRTHSQSFRFEIEGRRYWGEIVRTFDRTAPSGERTRVDVELRTDSGRHSRALPETAKAGWRLALVRQFKRDLESFVTDSPEAKAAGIEAEPAPVGPETPAADAARAQADSDIETGADVDGIQTDSEGRKFIDLTPTWAAMVGTFRVIVENSNAEGRRTAWAEIARMAALADERNVMAKELARREAADLSDVIQAYEMRGDDCQAPGAIVLRHLPDNDCTPFVVHFRNDQDSEREGRPCYYYGDYCATLVEGWEAFAAKVRRFDPTGTLGGESVR